MNEPSVLDFIKAKLMPWKYHIEESDIDDGLSESDSENIVSEVFEADENQTVNIFKSNPKDLLLNWPWYFLGALIFAIIGQIFMEPPGQNIKIAIVFYGLSFLLLVYSVIKKDPFFGMFPDAVRKELNTDFDRRRTVLLLLSFISLIIAFFAFKKFGSNDIRFNSINLFFWLMSLLLFCFSVLDFREMNDIFGNIKKVISSKTLLLKISPWSFLILIVLLLVAFFRFFRLDLVIGEMFSDHAEKLLDVYDVLNGDYHVFFIRNTGREFLQFYLTAFIAKLFNTGVSFISLKIGTAFAGFLALPFIYKLGKELGNRWVGLIAFFFAGISYWHNVISRVGLRFPFYPLFAAPAIYYLIRGLRQKRRNDFIYSGIAIGFGLHGYSSTRFLPFVILAGIILFCLHSKNKGFRFNMIFGLTILVITSFIIFLPLFKYTLINPEAVSYRAITRLGTTEREYIEPVTSIFLKNLWSAETMFFHSDGNTWVHSIPFRPALDFITAAFYFLGSIMVIIRYVKLHNWEDLFLIISVPLLMMPSILSLAFPEENPSLNRTGGAIVPVFIIAAIGFEGVFYRLISSAKTRFQKFAYIIFSICLLGISIFTNYDLVFNQFNKQFMNNAWNTSQIGEVIKGFTESVGSVDNAYVVPTAHWVDTRVVGIVAGFPTRDFALWPEDFSKSLSNDDQKLFILKPENSQALDLLEEMYPVHSLYRYDSGREGKDFLIYSVPAKAAPSD
ncbi:MAG: hypothetical protein CVU46_10360 [Chloroflexi bacterium HGW-Chloroflexi-8]|nr:MAG: hypothetical protein CVU46_10360 [Chloroflexi bacterium HGW-Chloroflexi-8]